MKIERRILMYLICFTIVLTVCLKPAISKAASEILSTSQEKNYVFTVPDGGMSNVKINVGNVVHYDGNGNSKYTHSSWKSISNMYDSSKWQSGQGYENTETRTYTNNTAYTGKLLYTITVSGALVPQKSGTLSLKFATK